MNRNEPSMTVPAMSTEAAAALLEKVVVGGDLSKLTAQERMRYYAAVCQSVGLNPMTQPFLYLYLQNRMTLYARKEATEQLREIHGVNVTKLERDLSEDYAVITAYGTNAKGRSDSSLGVVSLAGLHGQPRADAIMKAETKAKRRLTLSLCGLGVLDESEVDVPPGAVRATEVVTIPAEGGALPGAPPERYEAQTLFPTPEQDRVGLIQRAKIGAARMEKKKVTDLKIEVFGSAEAKYEDVDLAALVTFVREVEGIRL